MTTDHPMKLTLEQFNDLICQDPNATWFDRLSLAYAAGADAQLEACCEWLHRRHSAVAAAALREDMRPKPPSLAEQALGVLRALDIDGYDPHAESVIRYALERLAELEGLSDG